MEKRSFLLLKTLLVLVVITESAVIVPRNTPSGISVIGEDKKLEQSPGIRNPGRGSSDTSGVEYDHRRVGNNPSGQPSDYDYNGAGAIDENESRIKPEIIPEYQDETIDKGDGLSKPGDEENFEPFDGEEDSGEAEDEDGESKPPTDEYDESKPSGDEDDELKPEETDEKVPEESSDGEKVVPEEEEDRDKESDEEDDEKVVPEGEEDKDKDSDGEGDEKSSDEHDDTHKNPDDDNRGDEGAGHFFGGSIFDTPFFNLNKVRKYFNQMERALGRVFHQVLDEARLLNGTYANTTEEEVEIGGRKYVVQKSVIKGADDHSSIYVESLSTKPKMGNTKGIKGTDKKNGTKE